MFMRVLNGQAPCALTKKMMGCRRLRRFGDSACCESKLNGDGKLLYLNLGGISLDAVVESCLQEKLGDCSAVDGRATLVK